MSEKADLSYVRVLAAAIGSIGIRVNELEAGGKENPTAATDKARDEGYRRGRVAHCAHCHDFEGIKEKARAEGFAEGGADADKHNAESRRDAREEGYQAGLKEGRIEGLKARIDKYHEPPVSESYMTSNQTESFKSGFAQGYECGVDTGRSWGNREAVKFGYQIEGPREAADAREREVWEAIERVITVIPQDYTCGGPVERAEESTWLRIKDLLDELRDSRLARMEETK